MKDISQLSEEERAIVLARRAYFREWKRKNPERVKRINDRFFLKHVEKLAEEASEESPTTKKQSE